MNAFPPPVDADPTTTGLVLLAHGSASPAWGEPLRELRAELARRAPGLPVLMATLRGGGASRGGGGGGGATLEEAVGRCAALGLRRVIVVPVFLSTGGHLLRDLPQLVAQAAAAYPRLALSCSGALGEEAEVVQAMARACLRLIDPENG